MQFTDGTTPAKMTAEQATRYTEGLKFYIDGEAVPREVGIVLLLLGVKERLIGATTDMAEVCNPLTGKHSRLAWRSEGGEAV